MTRASARPATEDLTSIFRNGTLAGLGPDELARFETPFYVYDLDVVEARVAALRSALPARVEIAYAVKANPALAVVARLGELGLGADVASAGELELVARAGIATERVVFTGPGKRDDELTAAALSGLRAITVESRLELERLATTARGGGVRVPVLLRLAVGPGPRERVDDEDAGVAKFGLDPDDLSEAAALALRSPELDLLGVHAFGYSNVLDADRIADHVESTARFAGEVLGRLGLPVRLVDAGGGLGIPYGSREAPLDLERLGARLAAIDRAWAADATLRDARIVVEPGRFLVGPAGAYVCRVLDVKTVAGRRVAIVDGGIHHALRPALAGHVHRLRLLGDAAGSRTAETVAVGGPLCTSLDALGELDVLPRPGDLVALLDVGAYGFTESMALFLSHPMPAEIAVRAGRAEMIRPRLQPSSWLDAQRIPDW